jgi:hypothetical protein
MAQYSYSTPYTGQQVPTLPPGYMEAATAPGRNLAMGIASMGQNIGKAIEQYRTKKADTESATQSWETVSGMMQQQLSSDPKYLAIQQYMDTGALPQGVSEKDIPQFTQKVMADREMLNKFSSLGEKFPDMSLAKKKAALGDAVMVLNQYRNDQQNEVRDAAARQQLAVTELQLGKLKRDEAAAPFYTKALMEVMGRQPGQGPTTPYADVTQEMLGKYGDKLTQEQVQALIPMMRRMGQTLPAGLVPTGAKMGPGGVETEYGVPQTIGSVPLEGAPNLRQQTQGGKITGSPYEVTPQTNNDYLKLREPQKKEVENLRAEFNGLKTIKSLDEAGSFLNQMNNLGVGTPDYKATDEIALIFSFMKTLDPASTVREGEYASAQKAGGVPELIRNYYNKLRVGEFLTDDQRKNFINTSQKSYLGIAKQAEVIADRYRVMAKDRELPEHLVVPKNMFQQTKQFENQNAAQTMQRFQSPADMKAAGVTRGLVLNPATGKYQEFQD